MDKKDDGGPAFPVPTDMSGGEAFYLATPGMSLRDWFAGQALAGLIGSGNLIAEAQAKNEDVSSFAARIAFKAADAMLTTRKES